MCICVWITHQFISPHISSVQLKVFCLYFLSLLYFDFLARLVWILQTAATALAVGSIHSSAFWVYLCIYIYSRWSDYTQQPCVSLLVGWLVNGEFALNYTHTRLSMHTHTHSKFVYIFHHDRINLGKWQFWVNAAVRMCYIM